MKRRQASRTSASGESQIQLRDTDRVKTDRDRVMLRG